MTATPHPDEPTRARAQRPSGVGLLVIAIGVLLVPAIAAVLLRWWGL
jgi:hypothetical protein